MGENSAKSPHGRRVETQFAALHGCAMKHLKMISVLFGLAGVQACGAKSSSPIGGDANGGTSGGVHDGPSGNATACKVNADDDALGACTEQAPPNSFEPEVQWTWTDTAEPYAIVTPLVANLTDDNRDGAVDLCDMPDVVVITANVDNSADLFTGHLRILNGATGQLQTTVTVPIKLTTPAIADLNGDGVPEIVVVGKDARLYAVGGDGRLVWGPADMVNDRAELGAIAIADLNHDAKPEIILGATVYDNQGKTLWRAPGTRIAAYTATTSADINNDGFQEVLLGAAAYTHDGQLLWDTGLAPGFPQIGNLDNDPEPEVLLTSSKGVSLINHDGTVIFRGITPTGAPAPNDEHWWRRPATIHDFNGDGEAEFAMSSREFYSTYNRDGSVRWSASVADLTGLAAGTAFDFLGDGSAEAMYADERALFVFDATGQVVMRLPRYSPTVIEYPVVADVDNDGSAELVLVSHADGNVPSVQVIRDKQDRWVSTRRIWNQHTYHVTNVREDGTIPTIEKKSWQRLNTFRTNAQTSGVGVCQPPIE